MSTDSTPNLVEEISGVLLNSRIQWEIEREEGTKAQETCSLSAPLPSPAESS